MLLVMSPVGIWGDGLSFTHSVYGTTSSNKGGFRFNNHK